MAEAVSDRGDPPVSTMSVLVVDDAPELRLVVRMLLERAGGFEVVAEASDGQEAIELAEEHHPDVVLLDLTMPRLSGADALPRIREVSPRSVVIVLTGYQRDERIDELIAGGAHGALEKSDLPRRLAQEINRIMQDVRS
ncbi:MAG: response regulator transcription factor [Actinomycetota bacterium]|nr:response regulator transcription factor [Actinomycetota bacterium]